MDKENSSRIEKQFASLPVDLQNSIRSSNIEKYVAKLAFKHSLHIDQTGKLHQEVLFFLLGLVTPDEFVTDIVRDLSIERTTAESIARDADILIFAPVRNSLKKVHAALGAKEAPESMAPEIAVLKTTAGNEIPIPAALLETQGQAPLHRGPVPNIRTMPKDIAKIKMGESIRLPKEEIAMNYNADPYREKPE